MPEASAVTQDEIDDLKEDASALANQKKDLQAQLKDVRADKNAAQQQKDLIERQINVIQEEIDNMTAQIEKYGQLIQEKEVELAQAEADERSSTICSPPCSLYGGGGRGVLLVRPVFLR